MQSFWSHWAWPLATSLLGFVFTGLVFRQWLKRRRPHQMAWTIGLLFYAVAALMEFLSEYSGEWNPTVYRIYIVLAASLVAFLGLGTLYLLVRRRLWGHLYLGFTLVCLVVFLAGTFTTTLAADKLVPGITVGGQALGPSLSFPRMMSFFFNIPGAALSDRRSALLHLALLPQARIQLPHVGKRAHRSGGDRHRFRRLARQAGKHGGTLPGGDVRLSPVAGWVSYGGDAAKGCQGRPCAEKVDQGCERTGGHITAGRRPGG